MLHGLRVSSVNTLAIRLAERHFAGDSHELRKVDGSSGAR